MGHSRMTVVPAYGRDYSSVKLVTDAWNSGADFRISDMSSPYDGRYVSKRDVEGSNLEIWARYSKLTKIVQVQ